MLAEEQERRRIEAAKAQALADAKRREEEQAAKEAEEKRLAAERARLPETRETKQAAAAEAQEVASAAKVEAVVAEAKAEEAYVDTLSRPADIMRTRTSTGTLSTMQTETYSIVENAALLDPMKLWPYIKFDAKQTALNAWAKSTDFREPMNGASIGRRPKSQVR
jgi:hypothetical protein